MRFFLTGPLFGAMGAALMLYYGADALITRWAPASLAVLHCFTAGFMLQSMVGALFQVLPVAAGCSVSHAKTIASIVHPALTLGAGLLSAGFVYPGTHLLLWGASVLTSGCLVFVAAVAYGLIRAKARNPVRILLQTAAGGLAVTVGLGLSLAVQIRFGATAHFATLFNLHALWAFAGWALPLVAAVASLVVPMFYMAPRYPEAVMTKATLVWLVVLVVVSLIALWGAEGAAARLAVAIAALALAFAGTTLDIFRRRKRPRLDPSFHGWQSSMGCLAVGCALFIARQWLSSPLMSALEIAIGICLALGVFTGLIGAMQLKIVPFLCSLHLSPLGIWQLEREPSEKLQRVQVWSHTGATALALVALAVPVAIRPAAALLLASQVCLAVSTWTWAVEYRRACRSQPVSAARGNS